MFRTILALLAMAIAAPATLADSFLVTIKAVDATQKPVAKAAASPSWVVTDGVMKPSMDKPVVTDSEGKAVLRVDDWNQPRPVLVLSADQKLGAIFGLSKADDGKERTITLGPTIKVKGKLGCKDLNQPPPWANTMVTTEGFRPPFIQNITKSASFEFTLPAGKYTLGSYGEDVKKVNQTVTLAGGDSLKDLGTIDMKASEIAKLRGKPLPDWVISEARGVKPGVKISDYRGKWLLVEFWGWWCGPCIAGALPELISLYEDHAADRDKFEIIAIHEHNAKSFAEVDKKLPRIKEQYWQGKDIPFPVLIDATGKTAELYGISGYPTGLLIDPEGKLVGEVGAPYLASKLPPLSLAKQWSRQRDMYKNVMWSFDPDKYTFAKLADILKRFSACPIELDVAAVKACGFSPDDPLPGVLMGVGVTMHSIEELVLAPFGLGIAPAPDGRKLLITKCSNPKTPPSYFQELHGREINEELDRQTPSPERKETKPLEIKDQSLAEALQLINREFEIPLALDARAMHAKILDSKAKVSGVVGPVRLREGLTKLVEPLGLTLEVRDEVVLLTPKGK